MSFSLWLRTVETENRAKGSFGDLTDGHQAHGTGKAAEIQPSHQVKHDQFSMNKDGAALCIPLPIPKHFWVSEGSHLPAVGIVQPPASSQLSEE